MGHEKQREARGQLAAASRRLIARKEHHQQ
jgi:hypothetical protein